MNIDDGAECVRAGFLQLQPSRRNGEEEVEERGRRRRLCHSRRPVGPGQTGER